MGTVISNLKAKFGVETSDFKKGLKDGESAVRDFKGTAGSLLDDFASMFGINMSAVNDAVGTANKSLSSMASMFKGAATGGNVLTISMKALKIALLATGIGAIVVALGSLITYFTKSGEGADKFAKILAQVKSVFNNVIERIMKLGEGLFDIFSGRFKEGWEKMRTGFKDIGEEIKNDWQEAGKLAEAEDALEDREIALINSLEERRAKVAELRLMAKEEVEDNQKRLSLLQEAERIAKTVYADQISVEQERLRIMKEKLALQTTDPTDDQNREIAEQTAKINSLLREQSTELRGIARERVGVQQKVNDELALHERLANATGITVANINHLKMPDLSQTTNQLVQIGETTDSLVKKLSVSLESMNDVIASSIESALTGFGEWLGGMAAGVSEAEDLSLMVGMVLGGMLTQLGEVAIAEGIGLLAIKKGLETVNPYVALAAGVALVALGSSITGYLSNMSKNMGGSSSSSVGSNIYDTSPYIKSASTRINMGGKIELTAKGRDLVAVIDAENQRAYTNA